MKTQFKTFQQEQETAFLKGIIKIIIIGFFTLCSGMYLINKGINHFKNISHNENLQTSRGVYR